jgi:phospholipid-binding lipoprotein MlaA
MGVDLIDTAGIRRNAIASSARFFVALCLAVLLATMAAPQVSYAEGDGRIIILPAGSDDDVPDDDYGETGLRDPFEGVNRAIFAVNDTVDQVILRPVALVYRTVLPRPLRKGLSNFLSNASTPVTLANDILQGDMKRAETTVVRFFLNSVAGFGGLNDVASEAGWERHTEDFGQTLAVYGVPSGPYIVAPLLGPATPRHLVGRAVDILANPWTWILADVSLLESLSPTVAETISARDEAIEALDATREGSPDYYVTIKSLYHQNRESEINNGEIIEEDLPDIPDVR